MSDNKNNNDEEVIKNENKEDVTLESLETETELNDDAETVEVDNNTKTSGETETETVDKNLEETIVDDNLNVLEAEQPEEFDDVKKALDENSDLENSKEFEVSTKKKTKNKKPLIFGCVLLLILAVVGMIAFASNDSGESPISAVVDIIKPNEISEEDEIKLYEYIDLYDTNKAINADYIGQIVFDSGIINEPFVASKDNNDYLRKNFETGKYDELGTVFMDYECNLNSQNTVLYGHYVYSIFDAGLDENGNKIDNETLMFTPLKKLVNKEFFDANNKISIVLENEVRHYDICAIYFADLYELDGYIYPDEDQQYYVADFTKDYFELYKQTIQDMSVFDTGVDFKYSDKFLTLQTCVENAKLTREIVVCKYTGKTKLNRKAYEKYKAQLAEQSSESDSVSENTQTAN